MMINVWQYRLIARIIPLKHRLSFLISRLLNEEGAITIPYYKNYGISVNRDNNSVDKSTIADLIFEGSRYLPEYFLVGKIKKMLPQGFVCVDVGTNIGTTLWLMADKAKQIHAFEPMPHLYNTIISSVEANNAGNIDIKMMAIGKESGKLRMFNNNNSSIAAAESADTIEIPVSTLDSELKNQEQINYIKIDVEGYEYKVLQGASGIIGKHKPVLLIEIHPQFILNYQDTCEDVISWLENQGYSISFYSFLDEQRKSKARRFLNRFFPSKGRQLKNKNEFFSDIEVTPQLLSYHLLCEPLHA